MEKGRIRNKKIARSSGGGRRKMDGKTHLPQIGRRREDQHLDLDKYWSDCRRDPAPLEPYDSFNDPFMDEFYRRRLGHYNRRVRKSTRQMEKAGVFNLFGVEMEYEEFKRWNGRLHSLKRGEIGGCAAEAHEDDVGYFDPVRHAKLLEKIKAERDSNQNKQLAVQCELPAIAGEANSFTSASSSSSTSAVGQTMLVPLGSSNSATAAPAKAVVATAAGGGTGSHAQNNSQDSFEQWLASQDEERRKVLLDALSEPVPPLSLSDMPHSTRRTGQRARAGAVPGLDAGVQDVGPAGRTPRLRSKNSTPRYVRGSTDLAYVSPYAKKPRSTKSRQKTIAQLVAAANGPNVCGVNSALQRTPRVNPDITAALTGVGGPNSHNGGQPVQNSTSSTGCAHSPGSPSPQDIHDADASLLSSAMKDTQHLQRVECHGSIETPSKAESAAAVQIQRLVRSHLVRQRHRRRAHEMVAIAVGHAQRDSVELLKEIDPIVIRQQAQLAWAYVTLLCTFRLTTMCC